MSKLPERSYEHAMSVQVPKLTGAELREVGLFGALTDDVLVLLAATLTVVTPAAGHAIPRG